MNPSFLIIIFLFTHWCLSSQEGPEYKYEMFNFDVFEMCTEGKSIEGSVFKAGQNCVLKYYNAVGLYEFECESDYPISNNDNKVYMYFVPINRNDRSVVKVLNNEDWVSNTFQVYDSISRIGKIEFVLREHPEKGGVEKFTFKFSRNSF